MSDKLTDAERANLSPEELAAIDGDEDSRAELDEVADMKDGDEDGEGSNEEDGDEHEDGAEKGEGAEAEKPAAKAEGEEGAADDKKEKKDGEEAAGDEAKDDASDESTATDFTPRMVAQDVSKINDQIKTIAEQKAALAEQFENGDLKHSEYMAKRDDLSSQETTLRVQLAQADFAAQQNESTSTQRWEWEQDRFFEDHDIYVTDKLMHAALDAAVKDLAGTKDDKGKLVNDGKSLKWFLDEGHRLVSKRFKIEEAPKAGEDKGADGKGGKDAQGKAKGKSRAGEKPDLKGIPKTIGNLPAAEGNEAAESEFDKIDKLEGMDYEKALAGLTDDQQQRYLAR